ncbi:MAG TPA: nucleoside triphosphate pyrophosphohydrolase [Nitrospiria bacterium]|nr:nucleoside triphosphate pyrophosphohydrolase [Nitrospiria bacterium]
MSKRFYELVAVMDKLRGENGCPWDLEQTRESLKPFLLEEAYEVLEAIDEEDPETLKEELGDLLFQILFHSRIAGERSEFGIEDVLSSAIDKMTRRHPHVFGPDRSAGRKGRRATAKDVLARWEALKQNEKRNRKRKSVLDGVPKPLPALMRAYQLQTRASRVGFDWRELRPVWNKVREELKELEQAVEGGRLRSIRHELGDLFFALVNMARFLKLDPEEALRKTNRRFVDRFHFMEQRAEKTRRPLSEMTLAEMDRLWEEAKSAEKRSGKKAGRKTMIRER